MQFFKMFKLKLLSVLANKFIVFYPSFSIFIILGISGCDRVMPQILRDRSYFVAPDGSDKNKGTIRQPFKTIQKCADVVQPGESCQIRAGTYRETVKPTSSGTQEKPIAFTAYKDEVVIVSGTEPVNNWKRDRGSIFSTKVALPISSYSDTGFFANQLFINQEMMPEARIPNLKDKSDFLRPTLLKKGLKSQGGTAATIENESIPDLSEGWKGAKVWANEWYTTRTGTITGGNADKLTAQMTAEWNRGAFYMYLFGKLELLDSPGEWFYDGNQQTLYFWSPDSKIPQEVEVKQRNFAFDLSDRSYITVNNINLFANTITTSDNSTGIVLDGIKAKYVSHHMTLPPLPKSEQAPNSDNALFLASHAHDTGIQLRGSNHAIKNSLIEWSSGNGVLLVGKNHQVENNIIVNTNYMVSYAAGIKINGNGHSIRQNTISRTGRDAINIEWHTAGTNGRNNEIAYNDISQFGMLSTDLGAIYICCYVDLAGGSIHHNWIRDAKAFSQFWGTRGIYLDLKSFNSTIHHNVVWNIVGGKHSFNLSARGPRGTHQVFNNTFLGDIRVDEYAEAHNNILAASKTIAAEPSSHNLFMNTDFQFSNPPQEDSESMPNFTLKPDSPAVDAGMMISQITTEFVGDAPDIGAYELGGIVWQAGSTLEHNLTQNKP